MNKPGLEQLVTMNASNRPRPITSEHRFLYTVGPAPVLLKVICESHSTTLGPGSVEHTVRSVCSECEPLGWIPLAAILVHIRFPGHH